VYEVEAYPADPIDLTRETCGIDINTVFFVSYWLAPQIMLTQQKKLVVNRHHSCCHFAVPACPTDFTYLTDFSILCLCVPQITLTQEKKCMLLSCHQNARKNHDMKKANRCFENVHS
jgi:hypothetical protein